MNRGLNLLKVKSLKYKYPCRLSFRQNSLLIVFSLFFLPLAASKQGTAQGTASSFVFREKRRLLTTCTGTSSSLQAEMSAQRDSPSAQRNKELIWEVLSSKVVPSLRASTDKHEHEHKPVRILEVAAGCGVHTGHFASQLVLSAKTKPFVWYPTDPSDDSRASIQCYIDGDAQLANMVKSPVPLTLDKNGIIEEATASLLEGPLDLITCINMIHISPWEATLGLMKVAGEKLSSNGCLYCYGPYKVGGKAVESNL
jgi:hypothetical protein